MDRSTPATLTVRVRPTGGTVASRAKAKPERVGGRHILLLIHGFNNSEKQARTHYSLFTCELQRLVKKVQLVHFFWPGDIRGGQYLSAPSYPWQIPSALQSAAVLAEWLNNVTRPARQPAEVSFIGHSLGCRLILEALRYANEKYSEQRWPTVHGVALMAAAVPVELAEGRLNPIKPYQPQPHRMSIYHSPDDWVLRFGFPSGQRIAFTLGYESANYARPVGLHGEPKALVGRRVHSQELKRKGWWRKRLELTGLGHSEYWSSRRVVNDISLMFGGAPERETRSRELAMSSGPPSRPTLNRKVGSEARVA